MRQPTLIPVSFVTGFLGSGKTTLISRVLRDRTFGRVAVIVNEFGDVGLDHDLIASSNDSVLTLNTGCLCCRIQTDLARTITELHDLRAAGSVDYERLLIETSGLSDPSAMLRSIMQDQRICALYQVPFVVTLVDVVSGEQILRDHVEARYQIALADRLLISKTDLRAVSHQLIQALDGLNLAAPRSLAGLTGLHDLFGDTAAATLATRLDGTPRRLDHGGIETFSIVRDRPIPALALTMLLQALSEHCGNRLLRLKGFVATDEMPGCPMVIHMVGHVVSPPDFLPRWPGEDRRTRIVCITNGVPAHFVSRLLDAIEEEVRDAIER